MRALAVVTLIAGLCTPAWAQQAPPPAPARDANPQPTTKPAADIDATKLGVSLSRIQRQLGIADAKDKQSQDGLRLQYNVQVYGTAPKIELFRGVDLFGGPVPGSAPTHQQFIEHVTPEIYRTPTVPVGSFAKWLAQWAWNESKKSRCEEEIANYRALVMQGVSVSAPRCTQ